MPPTALLHAANILHNFCFREIEIEPPTMDYEPRCSTQCQPCAAVWVGSKSGNVFRIGLRALGPGARPRHDLLGGGREARAIAHLHDGQPFGAPGVPYVVVGRSDGSIELIPDPTPVATRAVELPPRRTIHLPTWYDHRCGEPLGPGDEVRVHDRTWRLV